MGEVLFGLFLLVLFVGGPMFFQAMVKALGGTAQATALAKELGLKPTASSGQGVTLVGEHRGTYVTLLVDSNAKTIKATMVLPCGVFGTIRWQTQQSETLAAMGALKDIEVGISDLDDRFVFDFADAEQARALLRHSMARSYLAHSFQPGTHYVSLTPSAITAKWAVRSLEDITAPSVREVLDGLAGLAELSRKAGQDVAERGGVVTRPVSARPVSARPGSVVDATGAPSPPPSPPVSPPAPEVSAAGAAAAGVAAAGVAAVGAAAVSSGPAEPIGASLSVSQVSQVSQASQVSQPSQAADTSDALSSVTGEASEESAPAVFEAGTGQDGRAGAEGDVRSLFDAGDTKGVVARISSSAEDMVTVVDLLSDFSLRSAAQEALEAAGPVAVPALIDRSTDLLLSSSIREILTSMGPAVGPALVAELEQRTDERQLEFLLELVDRLSLSEAMPIVEKLAKHDSFMVRYKAEQLVSKLGGGA